MTSKGQSLADVAQDYKLGDRETLDDLRDEIVRLLKRVEELFGALDANLYFRIDLVSPVPAAVVEDEPADKAYEIDSRGVAYPMSFVRAKLQLEQLETGEVFEILLDGGEPVRNVPASFADQGEEVLDVSGEDSCFRVRVRKLSN